MEVNFDWETSKENVLPIKKGRALTDLAAQKSHSKEAVFEKTIEENNDNGDILLGTYAQYFTYVRRRAGDSRSASKVLLEVSTFLKFMSFIHLYFLRLSPSCGFLVRSVARTIFLDLKTFITIYNMLSFGLST